MNEIDWLDELFTVCSLPSIDILKFLWSQDEPVDTHSIAKGTHMSMEEVYHHLQSLETQRLVKMKRSKTKNESRRVWIPTLKEFTILIKAEQGDFHYKSNIKQKSLKISDSIVEETSKEKLIPEQDNNIPPSTKIKIAYKDGNLELAGSEKFVEKYWQELKTSLNPVLKSTTKKKPNKKPVIKRKQSGSKRSK
jgi:hypothetical protein